MIGGLTAALIMVYQGNNLPLPLLFAAMALGSIAAGALWGFIPAWFKSRWNTNETLALRGSCSFAQNSVY